MLLQGKCVLVVEPEPFSAYALEGRLRDLGARDVALTRSPDGALLRASQRRDIDLAIIDCSDERGDWLIERLSEMGAKIIRTVRDSEGLALPNDVAPADVAPVDVAPVERAPVEGAPVEGTVEPPARATAVTRREPVVAAPERPVGASHDTAHDTPRRRRDGASFARTIAALASAAASRGKERPGRPDVDAGASGRRRGPCKRPATGEILDGDTAILLGEGLGTRAAPGTASSSSPPSSAAAPTASRSSIPAKSGRSSRQTGSAAGTAGFAAAPEWSVVAKPYHMIDIERAIAAHYGRVI